MIKRDSNIHDALEKLSMDIEKTAGALLREIASGKLRGKAHVSFPLRVHRRMYNRDAGLKSVFKTRKRINEDISKGYKYGPTTERDRHRFLSKRQLGDRRTRFRQLRAQRAKKVQI